VRKPGLPHEPARAAALGQFVKVLVVGVGGEENRQLGAATSQLDADLEAVVVAEAHVEEHALGCVALDRVQRGCAAAGLRNDVIAACLEEAPGGLPERRLVVDDHNPRRAAVRGLWCHLPMDAGTRDSDAPRGMAPSVADR
jgi:hypothetical protein